MLITIGRYRLNMFNTTRFDTSSHTVYFTDGSSVQLTEAESEALRIYWDGHAETLNAKNKENESQESGGRDFVLGSESA